MAPVIALPVWGASGTAPRTAQLSPTSWDAASSVSVGRMPSVSGWKRTAVGSLRSTLVMHATSRSPPVGVSAMARMRPRPGGRSPKPLKTIRQVTALSSLTSTGVSSSAASLELPARSAATSRPLSSRTRLGQVQNRMSAGAAAASKIVPLSSTRMGSLLCLATAALRASTSNTCRASPPDRA